MYVSNEIAERIKDVARSHQITVKKVLGDVGLGRNAMSNLKTSFPQADNLAKIADYLDCSVDYLLGRTDNPQAHKAQSNNTVNGNYNAVGNANTVTVGSQPLDNHQKLLIERYNKLPPEIQIDIIQILGDEKKIAALLDGLK